MKKLTILGDYPIRITSPFGDRIHPITGKWQIHRGVDISCPTGTPVLSPVAGTVRFTRYDSPTAGNYIFVEDFITGNRFGFMHLSEILVKEGDIVQVGEEIGKSGNTGQSTAPHLHFECGVNPQWERNGYCYKHKEVAVDPTKYIELNFKNY